MAFFLEAAFLGVLLFGRERVPPWVHFFAALMVAAGTLLSTFWILSANSWMQTPTGHAIVDGRFVPRDWLQIVFNPSFPYRLVHTTMAFFITTAFVVIGVAAFHLRRGRHAEESLTMQKMGLGLLAVLVPLQVVVGDLHGLNTFEHQPAKIAAIEGHWDNAEGGPTPLILFGWPDMQREETRFKVEIPVLGSLILRHSLTEPIPALKDFPREDRPNSTIVFWSFRVMAGLGMLMILVGVWSLWLRWREGLYRNRAFLRLVLWMGPSGLLALLAGWFTTEVGRQPWVVYGLMRTADGVSNHSTLQMSLTLVMFVLVYFSLFGVGIGYMMRLVRKGPVTDEGREHNEGGAGRQRTAARPLSATAEGFDEDDDHPAGRN
jgi:cytochrome d ubiquinol oxidase subunit I